MESTSTGPTSGSVLLQQSSLEESAVGGSTSESLPRASPIINLPVKTTGRNRSGNSELKFYFYSTKKPEFQYFIECILVLVS